MEKLFNSELQGTRSVSGDHEREITIDKDGTWYYRGIEMTRKDIVAFLAQHLRRDDSGQYVIECEGNSLHVYAEDAPCIIQSIDIGPEHIQLVMSDGNIDAFDPSTLYLGDRQALYCTVTRVGPLNARFSRASYYQLAKYIESDADLKGENFCFIFQGRSYKIPSKIG